MRSIDVVGRKNSGRFAGSILQSKWREDARILYCSDGEKWRVSATARSGMGVLLRVLALVVLLLILVLVLALVMRLSL